jgi:hypothetical protein
MTNGNINALTELQAIGAEALAASIPATRSRHSLRVFLRSISTMLTGREPKAKGKAQAPNQVSLPESPKGLGLRVLTLGFVEQCQIVEAGGTRRCSGLRT